MSNIYVYDLDNPKELDTAQIRKDYINYMTFSDLAGIIFINALAVRHIELFAYKSFTIIIKTDTTLLQKEINEIEKYLPAGFNFVYETMQ
jgi:hypothetical protein